MPKITQSLAVLAAGLSMAAAAACSSSSAPAPAPIVSHGTIETTTNILSGTTPADAYPDITDGSQVVVVSSQSNGTEVIVIATGSLTFKNAVNGGAAGIANYYTFTVTVPGGLVRYGIEIGHDRGTIWETLAQMKQGPSLCLGC